MMKYPLVVAVPLIAILILLGAPLLRVNVGEPWAGMLPPGAEAREGWNVAARELGLGELSPIFIVVQAPRGPLDSESTGALWVGSTSTP